MKKRVAALLIGVAIAAMVPTGVARGQQEEQPGLAEKRQLVRRGAKLWPVYCGRCHLARPASEFSPAQWGPIMMHMRSVAETPASDARALTEYLKSGR